MLNLILFGPPGSGKGTQAAKLVEKYNLVHISTGDLFRYEMGNNTPLGIKAKEYINQGQLVPDEVTIGMLTNKVEKHLDAKGFILDGFPRTVAQAEALDALLASKGTSVSILVELNVPEEEVTKRILSRGETSGRADDKNIETIKNRFVEYKEKTAPVASFYATTGKTQLVDGLGTIEEIFDRVCAKMDAVAV